MKKIPYEEKYQIYIEYRDIENPIEVTDFNSALERCKQQVSKNFKKTRAKYKRQQRKRQEVRDKEYIYQGKILRGEINIPSAERTRSFMNHIKKKYGSVYGYIFSKENKWYNKDKKYEVKNG